MGKQVAHFYKIPFEQFKKRFKEACYTFTNKTLWNDDEIKEIYDKIDIPKKIGGNVYVFQYPITINIPSLSMGIIPTEIECEIIEEDFVFLCNYSSSMLSLVEDNDLINYNTRLLSITSKTPLDAITYDSDNSFIDIIISNYSNKNLYIIGNTYFARGYFVELGSAF